MNHYNCQVWKSKQIKLLCIKSFSKLAFSHINWKCCKSLNFRGSRQFIWWYHSAKYEKMLKNTIAVWASYYTITIYWLCLGALNDVCMLKYCGVMKQSNIPPKILFSRRHKVFLVNLFYSSNTKDRFSKRHSYHNHACSVLVANDQRQQWNIWCHRWL